ncbi:MAG TPA: hypothetical protein PKD09_23320 [Aggregatilinea sp.]|uniref:hypothetical protein n=1 Tax=Aggregatilinea sp. TaxID=2806333 RepID=UPI002CC0CA12|nr:hypothetical protein [Aggregatilinea sp.]HML24603.1 hypothetical protein [Aggregatilinea sp.]
MTTRKEVLEMLSAGEIDVDRAAEMLLYAHDPEPEPEPEPAPVQSIPVAPAGAQKQKGDGRRWLHIHVSDMETGRNRVKVNVPLGLLQFGMKIGARFTDEVNSEMIENLVQALHEQELSGTLVEVEDADDNERVHIFVD